MRHVLAPLPQYSFWGLPYCVIAPGIKTLAQLFVRMDLVDILQDMSYLTTFLESLRFGSNMTEETFLYFDDARSSIEFRILCLPGKKKIHGDTETDNIEESSRLVALIYVKVAFFQVEPTAPIHVFLSNRLMIALMKQNLQSCWENQSELLLWVLFIGGSVTQRGSTRSWFLAALKMVCSYLHKSCWHDIKETLSNYLWSDRIWEDRCKRLWLEMESEDEN
jgi:hypothetical protein